MMKRLLILLMSWWIQIPLAVAQNSVIGKVSDASGQGLPGVTVLVSGTTTGTVTDFEGNFTIEVPDNGVLVFSFIGFLQKEVPINGQSIINVTLQEDTKSLDEVVVTRSEERRVGK